LRCHSTFGATSATRISERVLASTPKRSRMATTSPRKFGILEWNVQRAQTGLRLRPTRRTPSMLSSRAAREKQRLGYGSCTAIIMIHGSENTHCDACNRIPRIRAAHI
jgi:hypothetical protein